jgi:two-component system, OmpR family, response regulator
MNGYQTRVGQLPARALADGDNRMRPPMKTQILLIEDDAPLAGSLVRRLRRDGHEVELVLDGEAGAHRARELRPALVLLDLMLPSRSGLEILECLSRMQIPTIVITARVELGDRLRCFELGAVDYVPKPFFLEEISARVRARLGANRSRPPRRVGWDDALVDLDARTVSVGGLQVALTRYEFDILAYLVSRPGRAVSRAMIVEQALPGAEDSLDRTVDTHVARLRRKLGPAGMAIATVWGVGYRFDAKTA